MPSINKTKILYDKIHLKISVSASGQRNHDRPDLIMDRYAEIEIFKINIVNGPSVDRLQNGDIQEVVNLHNVNLLLTVIEKYIAHKITDKMTHFSLFDHHFTARLKQHGGFDNLCICWQSHNEQPEMFLNPIEAVHVKRCLNYALRFMMEVR